MRSYGRLGWTIGEGTLGGDVVATLQGGLEDYLTAAVTSLAAMSAIAGGLSRSLRCCLGLAASPFDGRVGAAPADLDASQAQAFAASVCEENPQWCWCRARRGRARRGSWRASFASCVSGVGGC